MENKFSLLQLKVLFIIVMTIVSCSQNAGYYDIPSEEIVIPATHLKIESAPDGTGIEILTAALTNGTPINLYAIARTASGQFVFNATVDWTVTGSLGYLTQTSGSFTTYTPNGASGDATVSATHTNLNPDSTGLLTSSYDVESITGLSLWLRAESITGSLTDGDDVTSWNDVNGSGRSVAALGAGQEPNFISDAINGLPVIRFNSSNNDGFISTFPMSDIISDSEYTYFIIFSATTIATDNIKAWENNALIMDNGGFVGATLRSGTPLVQSYNWDGVTAVAPKSIALSNGYLLTSYHESGSIYSQLNGDTASSFASGNTTDLTNMLTVGGGYAPAGFYNGDIAEIIVFNTSLSLADRSTVQDYLCNKYNLTCP